jgi:protein-L-isoaspartate(D-aspartate) O-methyltransferase
MSYEQERTELVDRLAARESLGDQTVAAMRAVPRHAFVPPYKRDSAYRDTPLPIGQGQTISAPHMVAIMTDLLALSSGDKVLEIGTGCGYHAAVTAEVVGAANVYSVEYVEELGKQARETLDATGYGDISTRVGDGREGWPEKAPFDRAYLTCAAPAFPTAVVKQVRPGGILLGPIEDRRQRLIRATVGESGITDQESHGPVRFVPLQ